MVELLSRIQFALTVGFHFLFVPVSIGLIFLVVIFEGLNLRKQDEKYRKLSNFFGDIFVINYAFGIVTGITMSLQFGTNWSEYSRFMGDVFGAPLVLEALIAFFLESTFTGIWIFKRNKISNKMRFITVFLIFVGTNISALWIITANGFMQNPVGFEIAMEKIVMTDFTALLTNPYAWYMLVHTNVGTFILGAMLVISIGSYKLLKGSEEEKQLAKIGIKIAFIVLLVCSIFEAVWGNAYMNYITPIQPSKIDMFSGGSIFVTTSFFIMVASGMLLIAIGIYGTIFFKRFVDSPTTQKIFMWLFFLPYIAIITGWIVAEVGRQPWIVYGLMKTKDAVSDVPIESVLFSLITITLLYVILGIACAYLTIKRIKKPISGGEEHARNII